MTFVPKYQWLTESGTAQCGTACDIVQIDTDTIKKFQVGFTPTEVINENFDGNNIAFPMEKIWVGLGSFGSGSGTGEYYGITFDIDLTNDNHFVNSFSFVYEGQSYCYIFTTDLTIATDYEIEVLGDFNLVKIKRGTGAPVDFYESYYDAFNFYLNDFGISCIQNGTPSLTVYGFPENTQVTKGDVAPYNTNVTNGIGADTWGLNNFLPINNQVCFFQISGLNTLPGGSTGTPSIFKKDIVIPANKRMIFTVSFTNSFVDETTLKLSIKDNFFTDIDTIDAIAEQGYNTVTFNYTTSATPPTSYVFDFQVSSIAGEINDSNFGFCFNSVKIETIASLSSINVQGCTTANVPFTEEYNDLYNSLITMNIGSLPNGLITIGKWILTLTDNESNTWTSITYETIDGTNCKTRNLIRLTWTSDCQFGNIDYKNLPFTNDIYVKGYYISQPLENKERVINTLSSGELEMIYNYSVEKKEFNFGIYTEFFFRTLQRAFEHKTVTLNGTSYKQDSDSVLVKKPEGQKYSGRIELVEVGSAVISSTCCC